MKQRKTPVIDGVLISGTASVVRLRNHEDVTCPVCQDELEAGDVVIAKKIGSAKLKERGTVVHYHVECYTALFM